MIRGRNLLTRRNLLLLVVALASPIPAACSRPSPEERIRAGLEEATRAAENRDVEAILELVSDVYSDNHGNDKAALGAILRYHFRESRSVHTLEKINRVALLDRDSARVELVVAAASGPVEGWWQLEEIDADVLRVELVLKEEARGRWRVTRADWRRVKPADLF